VLVEKVETYLSAVATNHYTCFDGLVVTKSNIANALAVPLSNVTQLYSISLGLATQALSKNIKKRKTRKQGLPTKAYKVRQPLKKLIKVTTFFIYISIPYLFILVNMFLVLFFLIKYVFTSCKTFIFVFDFYKKNYTLLINNFL